MEPACQAPRRDGILEGPAALGAGHSKLHALHTGWCLLPGGPPLVIIGRAVRRPPTGGLSTSRKKSKAAKQQAALEQASAPKGFCGGGGHAAAWRSLDPDLVQLLLRTLTPMYMPCELMHRGPPCVGHVMQVHVGDSRLYDYETADESEVVMVVSSTAYYRGRAGTKGLRVCQGS